MKIFVNVNKAIEHYNRFLPYSSASDKEKMTVDSLGKLVFKKDKLSKSSRNVYLSSWNAGKELQRCRVENLISICTNTGLPLSELITYKQ